MKRKITCLCESAFEVEVPQEINLDETPAYMDEIQNGSFLNFICPGCEKKHKPEFPINVIWPSKKLKLEIFPELERGEFYRRKVQPLNESPYELETIISFPEMAERLAVIKDGYETVPIEAIKYQLGLKAEEQYPDSEMEILYYGSDKKTIEFHIHGIKEDQAAAVKVPLSLYEKTLEDYKANPRKEIFSVLRVKSYLSYKNTMRPEELK